jgi:hypothetical protein
VGENREAAGAVFTQILKKTHKISAPVIKKTIIKCFPVNSETV